MEDKQQLFQQVIQAFKAKKFSRDEAQSYLDWIKLYLSYHHMQNPLSLGSNEVKEFLHYLSAEKGLMPSKQKEAYLAINFFYSQVLQRSIWSQVKVEDNFINPAIMEQEVVAASESLQSPSWVQWLQEPYHLLAMLVVHCGLRLEEALNLRIEDVDISDRHLNVRDAFGDFSEIHIADELLQPLALQVKKAQNAFAQDSRQGRTFFQSPNLLRRKDLTQNPRWYFLFPGILNFNLVSQQQIREALDIRSVERAFQQAKEQTRDKVSRIDNEQPYRAASL